MLFSNLSLSHGCSLSELRFNDLTHLQASATSAFLFHRASQIRRSFLHEGRHFLLSLTHCRKADSQTPKPCSKRPPWTTFSSAILSSPVSAIHVYNQEMSVGPKSIENRNPKIIKSIEN
ncbi:pentatricopeptide repeat-containing protein [Pyrus ussuriensis x Pyrus communis]|uniref:Pentatricopeptide repeat-containing protein n=1 Tax=Pyrus ussuriensis x Pyrus communis TaxID=2448454 RepID=A0A5N5GD37_9ROSA|nr:pentatricopeptide repeat-containing protein [Pyrus ussuriensis x Pyrus communis]